MGNRRGSVTPKILSGNVRRLRESRGLTQTDLAKLARVSRSTVAIIEGGATKYGTQQFATLQGLARALGVGVDALVTEQLGGARA